jgi:myo-inositol-1(or 4)-monophosphatase
LPGSDNSILRDALETVMREAGELARVTSRGEFKRWTKGADHSPVSEGDIAVNNLLRERLTVLSPQAGWLSEETEDDHTGRTHRLENSMQAWIVDPIDGTRAYISGRPDWTISVALVENGRPLIAALYAPVTDEWFLALAGGGATLNGMRIAANGGAGLAGARLAGPKRYLDRLATLSPGTLPQAKVFSLALRFARVAQGELDIAFATPGSHDWDLAAADLLVHEAGGAMTDLSGRSLRYNQSHTVQSALIAAEASRHASLIDMVRDRLPEFA